MALGERLENLYILINPYIQIQERDYELNGLKNNGLLEIERRKGMTELKPCPFCGGVGVLENGPHDAPEEGYSIAQIRCEKCHATVYGQSFNYYRTPYLNENGEAKHEASAIEAWNRRVTDERSDNRR